MTLTFNPTLYIDLLVKTMPSAIETDAEYERLLAIAQSLHFNKERTIEENKIYKLLITLIEIYESEQHSIPESSPQEISMHIMESSGLR